ncbi:FxsA family protein [Methylococcus sp. EFPC2]|uniref:FxsA family protein n=1 Tax=Methylococcus sp. EFPC2 TaxID=2812648 RepID=UPI0019675751|nr:FxsA family protein [Methylococcus sp. EFPC2]QSA96994.1 FxsA family protein [Methylococcus sp. EFPC2]
MNIAQWALLAVLSLPVLEIYVLIKLGGALGFFPTLLLLLGAAVWGGRLLQSQGLSTWVQVQQSLNRGEYPAAELVNGMVVLAGAALLLLPGFLSDVAGLLCLIPASRRVIVDWLLRKRFDFGYRGPRRPEGQDARTIEGEFKREDD